MAKAAAPSIEVYSEWVRIEPIRGRLVDAASVAEPAAARLEDADGVVRLSAAKNEYVSFQVIVRSRTAIQRISLGFGGLAGPRGRKIGRRDFEPHVQWYHDLGKPFGWIPDALIPAGKLEAPAGLPWKACGAPRQTVQGFWVDLFIPKDAVKGVYRGTLTVTCDGVRRAVRLAVSVWPFAIPDACSQVADMNAYAPGVARGWADLAAAGEALDSADYLRAERNTYRAVHEHRGLFHYIPYNQSGQFAHPNFHPQLAGAGKTLRVQSWAKYDRHVGRYLDGSAFAGTRRGPIPAPYFTLPQNFNWPADFADFHRKGYATQWRRIGEAFVEHARAKGWTKTQFELFFNHKQRYKFYPYDADEVRFLEDTEHLYYFRDISKGVFDAAGKGRFLWRIDSSWVFGRHAASDLPEFVKLWVVNAGCLEQAPEAVGPMRAGGATVWQYGGGSMLDAPLSWVWMWPVKTLARRLDGFTWWLTTRWSPQIWRQSRDRYATTLFFPGSPWSGRDVVGGIRAKVLRNAMQTIEYAYRLDKKKRPGAAMTVINRVLGADEAFWWTAGRPPASGSDAAAMDSKILADPLSWPRVRAALAEALVNA